ncbi:MAG: hypothetical protein U9N59_13690 [Campylobacterota bacterium]|nr:hypothetical protein [Campylobacterota bacterium]
MKNNLIVKNETSLQSLSHAKKLLNLTKNILQKNKDNEISNDICIIPFILKKQIEGDFYFSEDNKYFALSSKQEIQVWDINTMDCILVLEHNFASLENIIFSLDNSNLIFYDLDNGISIWDFETNKFIERDKLELFELGYYIFIKNTNNYLQLLNRSIDFVTSHDMQYIVLELGISLDIYNIEQNLLLFSIYYNPCSRLEELYGFIPNTNNLYIVTANDYRDEIHIYNINSTKLIKKIKPQYKLCLIDVLPDTQILICIDEYANVSFYDTNSGFYDIADSYNRNAGKKHREFKLSINGMDIEPSFSLSSDYKYIVSGVYDIRIWNIEDGTLIESVNNNSLVNNDDTKYNYELCFSNTIKTIKLNNNYSNIVSFYKNYSKKITTIAFNNLKNNKTMIFNGIYSIEKLILLPNNTQFITLINGSIVVYDINTGQIYKTLEQKQLFFNSIEVTNNEKYIVAVAEDFSKGFSRVQDMVIQIYCVNTLEMIEKKEFYSTHQLDWIQVLSDEIIYEETYHAKYAADHSTTRNSFPLPESEEDKLVHYGPITNNISISINQKYLIKENPINRNQNFEQNRKIFEIYSIESNKLLYKLEMPISDFIRIGNKKILFVNNNKIKIFNLSSGEKVATFKSKENKIDNIKFMMNEKYIVVKYTQQIKIIDIENKCLKTTITSDYPVVDFNIIQTTPYIIFVTNGLIELWNIESSKKIYSIYNFGDNNTITMDPNGFFIANVKLFNERIRKIDKNKPVKLSDSEIKYYRKNKFLSVNTIKNDFIDNREQIERLISKITDKPSIDNNDSTIPTIDIYNDEIPFQE